MSEWRAVIGLEVHAQLSTRTKLFCRCAVRDGARPNTTVCPVCLGLPGALPVPNAEAVRLALRAALALDCEVASLSTWSRKSYFYPDLPKGYQITQEDAPLARGGRLRIETPEGDPRWIGVRRLHLEEDAGKSVHGAGEEGLTGVDYNRCGRPLIEIVTEPEIGEPEHARRVFERLRGVLVACGVSRGDLESGAMRCDANVSVHRRDEPLGSRIEIKNLNSLRFLRRALAFEIERQRRVLESGEPVPQETRTWDERAHRTRLTRVKEDEPDYRYFPDPDLLPVEITGPMRARASEGMPELPHETADRFVNEWGVSRDEAHRLTLDPALADYYERVARTAGDGRLAAGWVLSELAGRAHAQGRPVGDELVPARALGTLADRVRSGRLSRPAGKQVLDEMIRSGKGPDEIARVRGLERIEDTDELAALCREVVANHPRQVSEYRAGKKAVLGFLIGRVMEASGSRADPKQAGALLRGMLES